MAAKTQIRNSFDPVRDVAGMTDAFLRTHGINGRGSIPFYRDLARLLAHGQTVLQFASWRHLADALMRLRGDDRGLRHKQRIDDKLTQLVKQGLIQLTGYDLEFLPPDRWRSREVGQPDAELRCVVSTERQGSLFESTPESTSLRVFDGADQGPKTESAFGFQESAFPGKPKALSVLGDDKHTLYPRAPVVESSRLDESTVAETRNDQAEEVESRSRSKCAEVSQEELVEAQHTWRSTVAKWRARGITHKIDGDKGASNVKAFLKAAILLQRGQLSEAVYAAAIEAPVLTARIETGPFALVWTEWKRDRQFKRKIARIDLPSNWRDGIRRAEVAVNGEEPQRE